MSSPATVSVLEREIGDLKFRVQFRMGTITVDSLNERYLKQLDSANAASNKRALRQIGGLLKYADETRQRRMLLSVFVIAVGGFIALVVRSGVNAGEGWAFYVLNIVPVLAGIGVCMFLARLVWGKDLLTTMASRSAIRSARNADEVLRTIETPSS
ncbi:hypothetical protein [Rhodococcus qingshengii]|uniref:Uncharacterized protein n=1 Tax=Rhodococcus qingshengii TaxID=334542 RepID=A0A2A5J110_RHOSG|nr:hypothetical protein [Rhodococcus qingshengii]PCK23270.1 hypothetical protein CHR55_30440 [Rhodococcus qingshengii]